MKKDIKNYINKNVAVFCSNKQELQEINNIIISEGGASMSKHFHEYTEELCLTLDNISSRCNGYSNSPFFEREPGWIVYNASDFLKEIEPELSVF